MVEFIHAEAADHLIGLFLGIERRAGIARPPGIEVKAMSQGAKAGIHELMLLSFRFLQAHHIRLLLLEPAEEPFGRGGADAVAIERYDAHVAIIARERAHAGVPTRVHSPRAGAQRAALRPLQTQIRSREPL